MHPSFDVLTVTTLTHLNDPSSVTDTPMLSTDQMVDKNDPSHAISKPVSIVTSSFIDVAKDEAKTEQQQRKLLTRPKQIQESDQVIIPTIDNKSKTSNNTKKSVRFESVSIRVYDQCLGDHPCCSDGLPLSLDWTYSEESIIDIDTYENQKRNDQESNNNENPCQSAIQTLRLDGHERQCILENIPSYQKHKMLGSRIDRDQSSFHLGGDNDDFGFQSCSNLDDLFTVSLDFSSSDDSCLTGKDLHDVFDVEMMDSSCTDSITTITTSSSDDKSSIDNNDLTLLLVPSLEENESTVSSVSSSESCNNPKTLIDKTNTSTSSSTKIGSEEKDDLSLEWKRVERRHFRERQGFDHMRINHEFFTPPESCSDDSVGLFES